MNNVDPLLHGGTRISRVDFSYMPFTVTLRAAPIWFENRSGAVFTENTAFRACPEGKREAPENVLPKDDLPMKRKIAGWGRYPALRARVTRPDMPGRIEPYRKSGPVIPYGLGRSYGDSALSTNVLMMDRLDRIESFDPDTGIVVCESGVTLEELINHFLHRGWFLSCTPGTRYVTVGGAIASDVHGKNHHVAGCFSESVTFFDLMLPDGTLKRCSKAENRDFFLATCGGMGLTGLIVRAGLTLKPVNSSIIRQTTVKARNLTHIFELFEAHSHEPYSVAWIDCLSKGDSLGRSLLMVGDHADDGRLTHAPKERVEIPVDFPSFTLNSWSVRAFNMLYYHRIRRDLVEAEVDYETFFYPLDAVGSWNRIYGKNGFTQYQFVLPKAASREGLTAILKRIADSGLGSFLAVLKLFGKGNDNWLSFPEEGYTLALDMKIEPRLFPLLTELDAVVTDFGGRIYLTKDVRMSRGTFEAGYPLLERFREFRKRNGLSDTLQSLQSKRLEY